MGVKADWVYLSHMGDVYRLTRRRYRLYLAAVVARGRDANCPAPFGRRLGPVAVDVTDWDREDAASRIAGPAEGE